MNNVEKWQASFLTAQPPVTQRILIIHRKKSKNKF